MWPLFLLLWLIALTAVFGSLGARQVRACSRRRAGQQVDFGQGFDLALRLMSMNVGLSGAGVVLFALASAGWIPAGPPYLAVLVVFPLYLLIATEVLSSTIGVSSLAGMWAAITLWALSALAGALFYAGAMLSVAIQFE